MTKSVKERRKSPRIDTQLAMQVEMSGRSAMDRPLTTESINLSAGGICANVRNQLEPLTKVGLTLLLPSFGPQGRKTQVINCGGVVVRCEPAESDFDLACAFTDVKKEDRRMIEEYIGWRLMQDLVDERLSQP